MLKLSGKQLDKPFTGPVSQSVVMEALQHYHPHTHTRQAVVFDGETSAYDAIMAGEIKHGQVLIIRYEGPKGRYESISQSISR